MTLPDTDHLVIGAGAMGLAFADALLDHGEGEIVIVDRRAHPGGHWNVAYPFVRLHQPSSFYGVNSMPLGTDRIDAEGPNAGYGELASGAEVLAYFRRVMDKLLASGRVRYLAYSECLGADAGRARIRSLEGAAVHELAVRRRVVDTSWYSPEVPAEATPSFAVADGVRRLTSTGLAESWSDPTLRPSTVCVLGAGKTAMDAIVWLLGQGLAPEAIHWVMPRDSWVLNRRHTQNGDGFFDSAFGGQLMLMRALAEASDADDFFLRLEAAGFVMRIDRTRTPRLFHYATLSEGELEALRRVQQVIRLGRVTALESDGLVLEQGRVALPAGTAFVDCTASATNTPAGRRMQPVFQPGRIVLQLVRAPHICLSAALIAFVETLDGSDEEKNALCAPVPFPREPAEYVDSLLVGLGNQMRWAQHDQMRRWLRTSRLDAFARLTAHLGPEDTDKRALLEAMRAQVPAAAANARRMIVARNAARAAAP